MTIVKWKISLRCGAPPLLGSFPEPQMGTCFASAEHYDHWVTFIRYPLEMRLWHTKRSLSKSHAQCLPQRCLKSLQKQASCVLSTPPGPNVSCKGTVNPFLFFFLGKSVLSHILTSEPHMFVRTTQRLYLTEPRLFYSFNLSKNNLAGGKGSCTSVTSHSTCPW